MGVWGFWLETFLAGALYRKFREFMRILTTFLGKTQKSIIISTNGRSTRIMMDFCGFFQGKSSEFAWIPEIPYTMHLLKKSPIWPSDTKLVHSVSFLCCFRLLLQETLPLKIPSQVTSCNVMIGAALAQKQQFSSNYSVFYRCDMRGLITVARSRAIGDKTDHLPNFCSRRIVLGNSMCFLCTQERF